LPATVVEYVVVMRFCDALLPAPPPCGTAAGAALAAAGAEDAGAADFGEDAGAAADWAGLVDDAGGVAGWFSEARPGPELGMGEMPWICMVLPPCGDSSVA
jgi:hypothetical protein